MLVRKFQPLNLGQQQKGKKKRRGNKQIHHRSQRVKSCSREICELEQEIVRYIRTTAHACLELLEEEKEGEEDKD